MPARALPAICACVVVACSLRAAAPINLNHTIGVGATLNVPNADTQTLSANAASNALSNNGTLSLSSVGNFTNLVLSGGVITFTGTGSVMLSNNANNRIYGSAGTESLVNAAGHTIQGGGQIGLNLLSITNQGLIVANQAASLTIDPNATGFTNTGTLRATNAATLILLGGAFNNSGGTIEAQAGSNVNISGSTTVVTGGNLTSTGTGRIRLSNSSRLSALTITSGSNLEIANTETVFFNGALQNAGTIKLLSTGSLTNFVVDAAGATLSGGGTISLSNNSNNRIYGASTTTTLVNENHTIAGAGQIGVNLLQLDNRATIDANHSGGTLTLDPSGSGALNTGTMQASNGGILRLQGATFDNTSGAVRAQSGSKVQVASATVTNGTIDVAAGGTLELDTATLAGGTVSNANTGIVKTTGGTSTVGGNVTNSAGGQLQVANNTTLQLHASGTFNNAGTLALNSIGNLTNLVVTGGDVTLGGTGNVTLSNNGNNRIYGATTTDRLINDTGHTIQGSGQLGLGLMGFTNRGVVSANQSTALIIDPSLSGAINNGTFRASNNATLEVTNGTYANTGGTIEALAGSTVRFENATINGGSLTTAGTGRLVNALASTYNGVTLATNSAFDISNNTTARFSGNLTNQGTVSLNSVGNLTDLIVDTSGLTLDGGGMITLGNNFNNRIYGASGTPTLVNQNNTIRGAGQIGVNLLTLDNRATIEASISGSTLEVAAVVANTGTLQAVNGATLRLESSTINNAGGAIRADGAGSKVDLATATVTGGTLTTANAGVIRSVLGANTLGGAVNISTGAQLGINNNTSLTLLASGVYTNEGSITLSSVGNFTDLKVSGGDVTLNGAGTIELGNNANNRIYGTTVGGTDRLLNAGGTIRGSGQIGVGLMGLVNQGTIKADQTTSLTIDPSAAGVTNTGRLQALAGSTLRLGSGTFTNTNGFIEALGTGAVVEFSGASIVNGTLTSEVGAALKHIGGSAFTDVTLTPGTTLEILNNTLAHVAGTLINRGNVGFASVGNFTDLVLSGDVLLDGGGTLALGNNVNNRIYGAGTNKLTNQNNTIQGSGQLGVNLMGIVNHATIKATQAAALVIDPSAAGMTNTGLLRAETGAALELQQGTFTNTGGTIEAFGANARVNFDHATVVNGTLHSANGGALRNVAASSFTDVFLGGSFHIPNATAATFSGTLTNGGLVQLQSVGNFTDLIVGNGNLTMLGGEVQLSNNINNRIIGAASTNTLVNQGALIRGAGQIGANLLRLDNRGVIDANISGATLIIDPSGSGAVNSGLLTASNGGILHLQSGSFDNTGGTISAGVGSRVELDNASVQGGFLGGSTIRNVANSTLTALNVGTGVSVEVPNATVLTLAGAIGNNGAMKLQSVGNFTDLIIGASGATLNGHGVIELSNNVNNRLYGANGAAVLNNANNTIRGSGQLGIGQLTLTNTGTIEANQSTALTVNLTNGAPFTNQGTLRASNGGNLVFVDALTNGAAVSVQSGSTFTAQAAFAQTGGSTSLHGGAFHAASAAFQGGVLQGSGTLNGPVTNSGVIAPGANGLGTGLGALTFNHALTLTPTSLLHLELGGTSTFDTIGAQIIALGGSLAVSFANGFQFSVQPTDTFTLISTVNAGGLTGTFAGLANGSRLLTADGFGSFQVNYFGNSFRLSQFEALAIPEPSTYVLLAAGAAVIFMVQRRRQHDR